jgi:hypothetical protein
LIRPDEAHHGHGLWRAPRDVADGLHWKSDLLSRATLPFGTKGGVVTAFPGMNIGGTATVALQTNGDIVAAGNAGFAPSNQSQFTSSFALARYLSGGQLDTAFGNEGRVSTSFGSTNVAFIAAMVIQNHGKIVVAGETGDAGGSIAVARYLAQ